MPSLSATFHGICVASALLLALPTWATTTILHDHRAVGMVGWVLTNDAPLEFHSINKQRSVTSDGPIGRTSFDVKGDHTHFINSHARLDATVFSARPFESNGMAQASYRNFTCCPVEFPGFMQSQFYTFSEFQVDFRIDKGVSLALDGVIGVIKGQFTVDTPLESQPDLTVFLEFVHHLGGLGGATETLYRLEMSEADLFNPDCPIGSTDCNGYFLPVVSTPVELILALKPGDYGLYMLALASSISNFDVPVWQDGSGWFDVTLTVPEPTTLALATLAALLGAGALRRGQRHLAAHAAP